MKTMLVVSALFVTPCLAQEKQGKPDAKPSETAPSAQSLENTKWVVKVTPDKAAEKKGEKAFDDTLIFANKKVSMSECTKLGFKPSEYTVAKEKEAAKGGDEKGGEKKDASGPKSPGSEPWSFKTEQVSDKEGKSLWNAKIVGDTIEGTLVWTKKGGDVVNYTFTGKKEVAKKEEPKKEGAEPTKKG